MYTVLNQPSSYVSKPSTVQP